MALEACSPTNSIIEKELQIAAEQNTIKTITVMEVGENFYLVIEFLWAEGRQWYLSTRRDRNKPKVFKDLSRLNNHLKTEYPTESFTLLRNQALPPQG